MFPFYKFGAEVAYQFGSFGSTVFSDQERNPVRITPSAQAAALSKLPADMFKRTGLDCSIAPEVLESLTDR